MTNATFDDVASALARHANQTSKAEAIRVLESVAGTTSLRAIDQSRYADVIAALDGTASASLDPIPIFARWNSHRRAPT